MEESIIKHRDQIPKKYRAIYDKAMRGRSIKAAVKAQCLECTGWKREEIRLCSCPACPLYFYRPYK